MEDTDNSTSNTSLNAVAGTSEVADDSETTGNLFFLLNFLTK